jgi:uncharacterized membrane protein
LVPQPDSFDVTRRTAYLVLLLAAFAVVLPQLAVPLLAPPGTLRAPVDTSFSAPVTWPYAFGAAVCHQRPDRSFALGGNQLPVCERCLAIEFGMLAAFGAAVALEPRGGFVESLGAFLPRRLRSRTGVLAVGLALMLPMVLDGGLQLVTVYVSAAPQRVVTGFLYGIGQAGIVIGISAWFLARRAKA